MEPALEAAADGSKLQLQFFKSTIDIGAFLRNGEGPLLFPFSPPRT